ncbi:hypothetical protein TWF173_006069 [Orbilia oligospora]|nr:hypothetical protein TWF173_006069 [Orbilia oligospora]
MAFEYSKRHWERKNGLCGVAGSLSFMPPGQVAGGFWPLPGPLPPRIDLEDTRDIVWAWFFKNHRIAL